MVLIVTSSRLHRQDRMGAESSAHFHHWPLGSWESFRLRHSVEASCFHEFGGKRNCIKQYFKPLKSGYSVYIYIYIFLIVDLNKRRESTLKKLVTGT